MRIVRLFFVTVFLLICYNVPIASAIEVGEPPEVSQKTDSPVTITSYMVSGWRLGHVQLFNASDEVVNLTGWRVEYTVSNGTVIQLPILDGLLKPGGYVVLADQLILPMADFLFSLDSTPISGTITKLAILPSALYFDHIVSVKADTAASYWKRNISTTTGNYLSTFSTFQPTIGFTLYGKGLYDVPEATYLQVTEILANPRSCSPADVAGECRDFIKLHNPTSAPANLADFRLRVGYQGQTSSTSNTFILSGTIEPGGYKFVQKDASGRFISLTNSGAFVWLEDRYGVKIYETTIMEYPDANSDSKKGQAWAYDPTDGVWKWTSRPVADDGASVFPMLPVISKASNVLASCKEGQYRSEETNRCRSIASVATALAPCDEDEERNPETNRCRKIAAKLTSQLAPCKEGQERNPETNRCRNVASASLPPAAFAVEPVAETGKAFAGWWALGGVGSLAVGYGAWEWRREVVAFIQKVGSFLTSQK